MSAEFLAETCLFKTKPLTGWSRLLFHSLFSTRQFLYKFRFRSVSLSRHHTPKPLCFFPTDKIPTTLPFQLLLLSQPPCVVCGALNLLIWKDFDVVIFFSFFLFSLLDFFSQSTCVSRQRRRKLKSLLSSDKSGIKCQSSFFTFEMLLSWNATFLWWTVIQSSLWWNYFVEHKLQKNNYY